MNIERADLKPPKTRLGSGEFGRVFESEWEGETVVMKIMKHAISVQIFWDEIKILLHLSHPNIPRLVGYTFCQKENFMCLLYEKMPGIDLFYYIQYHDIPTHVKKTITREMIETLEYIHSQGVIYRDFKPENIIIDTVTKKIRIIDFGISCLAPRPIEGMAGTPGYMAPEILRNQPYHFPVDLYSYGITLFVLWTEKSPVKPSKMAHFMWNLPHPIKKLILACTEEDPARRPLAREIIARLDPGPSLWDRILSGCWGSEK